MALIAPNPDPLPPSDTTLADVVAQLAAEVAGPLTQALQRVVSLASHGSIDRGGLAALRHEIDGARRAGLLGQQIARFAHGHARPGIEPVDLGGLLREVLTGLAAHAAPGTPGHRQHTMPVQVIGDASLLHTLVEAAASWAQGLAADTVRWHLDVDTGQPLARLACRFRLSADADRATPDDDGLDTLDWLLLRYAAHVAGASVARGLQQDEVQLTLRLRHLVTSPAEAPSTDELDNGPSTRALLTGCQLLVLAARREPRQRVRRALRGHDVFIDHVPSVAAAEAYCDDGSPQVLLYDQALDGERLHALQDRLARLTPPVTMVALMPEGCGCELEERVIRLGLDGLAQTLPPVLLMELGRQA